MPTRPTSTRLSRWAPWALAIAGIAMIALATGGLRALLALLALIGLSAGGNDAAIDFIVIDLIGGGIVCLIVGLILALARTGNGKATWLKYRHISPISISHHTVMKVIPLLPCQDLEAQPGS